MARSIEQVLREYVGDQVLALAKLTADLEAAREELAALKAAAVPVPPAGGPIGKPNGAGAVDGRRN